MKLKYILARIFVSLCTVSTIFIIGFTMGGWLAGCLYLGFVGIGFLCACCISYLIDPTNFLPDDSDSKRK